MSLLSTLAKVAVGVAVAKGVSGMVAGKQSGSGGVAGGGGGAGSGSVFGGRLSPGNRPQSGGGGGLGDLLKGSGLEDLLKGGNAGGLGGVLSGRSGSGGGIGGMLENLSNASRPSGGAAARPGSGSLGDLLNQSLDNFGEPDRAPTVDQEESAKILLRAMLQAAKSDGRIDAKEKKALLGQVGDISGEEMAFVNEVLERPVDVNALAQDVPNSMAGQVYSMSLLAIDLDSKKEASYLHDLAQALNIGPQDANAIHEQMGEPQLYR